MGRRRAGGRRKGYFYSETYFSVESRNSKKEEDLLSKVVVFEL